MKTKMLAAALCALLAAPAAFAGREAHWSYSGRTDAGRWADLDKRFRDCRNGEAQSPVDLGGTQEKTAGLDAMGFAYGSGPAELVNNGHTVQVNLPDAGTVRIDGTPYRLLQFHFHTPSETTFDGKAYPLAAHLVHRNAEGRLAVVAVLFRLGMENAALRPVLSGLPARKGERRKLAALDPSALLPAARGYYAYMGSLTTPPCSEGVRWRVFSTPLEISAAQLAAFRALYPMNARPAQPLNGRAIRTGDAD
ncbi:carbonic anhydrase [Cupriavidus sp. 30B13]|uniref:carbonic anhydrase n=1 Tax=Cupriavidus sp. 30B13 TaxID=3384241 RepID=UPI003B917295